MPLVAHAPLVHELGVRPGNLRELKATGLALLLEPGEIAAGQEVVERRRPQTHTPIIAATGQDLSPRIRAPGFQLLVALAAAPTTADENRRQAGAAAPARRVALRGDWWRSTYFSSAIVSAGRRPRPLAPRTRGGAVSLLTTNAAHARTRARRPGGRGESVGGAPVAQRALPVLRLDPDAVLLERLAADLVRALLPAVP